MIKKIIFLLLLCGIILSGSAQNKIWTMQECVDYALKNNIQIKQSEIATEISEHQQTQSFYNMFPSLNGSGSYSYNRGRSVDPTTYRYTTQDVQAANLSLNTNVVLFNGFQLQNELKQSKLDYMSGKYDLDKIKNDISLNVAAAYLQVLYNEEQLGAQTDRVDAAKKQTDRTKILVDAGTLPKGSFLDAEAQLATEELSKVNFENQLANSYLTLTQLLELETTEGFTVEKPKIEIPDQASVTLPPAEIFKISLTSQPEIKSSEYKVQSAEKGLSIAKGSTWPRLSLFGSWGTNYSDQSQNLTQTIDKGLQPNGSYTQSGEPIYSQSYDFILEDTPFSDQANDNLNKSFGFSLSVPIFNGLSANTNVKRARLNLENAKYSSELTKNQLYKSIQQAHTDAVAALNRYKAADKSVAALTESFTYTEKKYNAGLLTSIDYTTARNNLTKSESDMLQAKYDFIFRLKVLDFYMGKPLVY
ncbi:MAG: TolC family protein [Bacteroidia bacterium]